MKEETEETKRAIRWRRNMEREREKETRVDMRYTKR